MLAKHYKKTILTTLSLLLLAGAVFSIIHFWPHPPTLETTLKNSGQAGEEIRKNFSSEEQLAIQKTDNGFEVKDDLNLKIDFPQSYTNNITATLPGGKEIKIIDRNAKDISGKLLSSQKTKKDNDIVEYKLDNRKTIYYSYQKDGSGTRKIKNWILYQNGNGNEKESYQFQNAKITLDKVGNANVSYYDERSNSNPTPSTATLRIPKPFYVDKYGKRTDLDWKLDQKSNTLSIEWSLKKDQYPIALDPTMVFSPSSANAAYEAQAANNTSTTISDYETTSFTAGNYTSVGTTGDSNYATTTATHTPTYVDDVFSTYLYTGNGSTQTINNGIDLAGKGGLVWIKGRSGTVNGYTASNNTLTDTARGVNNRLVSNGTTAQDTNGAVNAFNSNGFSINVDGGLTGDFNNNLRTYVSWTFRKAPKFFDVVTYTGDGSVSPRQIVHSLGITPGMIIIKRTDTTSDWTVWHKSVAGNAFLQTTDAWQTSYTRITSPDATTFTVGDSTMVNAAGGSYVAYLFADDPDPNGLIRCGSFTGSGAGVATNVNLGWEPQFIIAKRIDAAQNWHIFDTMRGDSLSNTAVLYPNLSNAEYNETNAGAYIAPTSAGFVYGPQNYMGDTAQIIYCAIRRPNKPPTSGTGVYDSKLYTSGMITSVTGLSFSPDLLIRKDRSLGSETNWYDRLRGISTTNTPSLSSNSTSAENTSTNHITSFDMSGFTSGDWSDGTNSANNMLASCFHRAPGVFDTVAYTGTGNVMTISHNLGVAPELIIIKERNGSTYGWPVGSSAMGWNNYAPGLSVTSPFQSASAAWDNTSPTNSAFTVGSWQGVSNSGTNYIAYLFATKPGISKVGSYTGNGSSQTINAGFTGGAKYILIKRTDNTGDWYVWDSTRGIVAGNDPHISLNTTAAEVTGDDSVDPDNSGFIVNQNATTNINVNGGTYIYLAFSGDTIAAPPTPPAVDTYATQLYTFNLPDMTNISKLQVDLTAYATASAGNGIVAKIWNNHTNDWETLTDLGNTDSSMPGTVSTQELTTNLSYYLDGNNQAKILVSSINPSDTSASAVLNVDYVNLTSISSAITTDTNDAYEATPTSTTSTTLSDYQTTALDAGDYAKVTAKDADYVSSSATSPQYVDDVFSTYLYTGNGSTQTINNGIDLQNKGGMVWLKDRMSSNYNGLYDTQRGAGYALFSDLTSNQTYDTTRLTAFNSNGFNLGSNALFNANGDKYVSWTFRKAPKFFDVVTYTGDGNISKTINHSLGVKPGFMIIKRTDQVSDWYVIARNNAGGYEGVFKLNTTDTRMGSGSNFGLLSSATAIDTADFYYAAGNTNIVNVNGANYVAYLFADDPDPNGIIRCGSFTTDGSGNASVNLGWEPQWVMWKKVSSVGNWGVADIMRGMPVAGTGAQLAPNAADVEVVANVVRPSATGFYSDGLLSASSTYIYCAIRRPNKPPTSGTQVYNAIARTGTGAAATVTGVGFTPDLFLFSSRNRSTSEFYDFVDRLRGRDANLSSAYTMAETAYTNSVTGIDNMDGFVLGADTNRVVNYSGYTYINHFLRRAPGVFDEVAYTGTGATHTISHNLGVAPELMIVKVRSTTNSWVVYSTSMGATNYMYLNNTLASSVFANFWNSTSPTSSDFTVGSSGTINGSGSTYVAYLFATKPGISKVGSYTGNGTNQTINAGFTGGAKYILIKRTDNTGDWYVWDSTRGIVAGNDPHLSLNTTAAEVTTDDSVDPDNSGFIVNQNATTNINVNGGTYIYLAFSGDTISAPATGKYATQLYSFDLSNISDITKLRVTMNAYATASAGNGVTAKIWNNHTNDWEILNTLTNTASSMPTTASKQDISTNVDYYLDNDNKVKILLTSTNPSITGTDATIYTDLISVSSLTTPIVSTINPTTTPNTNQTIDISLTGQNFASGATVTFKRTNQPDIPCKNVSVTSATALTCSANLRGANAGAWDITVTNVDQMEGTLSGAMTVTEGPHAPFTTTGTVKLRGSVRMERSGERTSP